MFPSISRLFLRFKGKSMQGRSVGALGDAMHIMAKVGGKIHVKVCKK